jgi:hypothetical protein
MKPKKIYWCYIVCTTAAAFLLGALFHNMYEWSGNNTIVGLFFPVNESVWEHLKLVFYPVLILWAVTMHHTYMEPEFGWTNRCFAGLISISVGFTVTAGLYYLCANGFGLTGMIFDLGSYAIGLFCGQFLATHLTFQTRIPKWIGIISIVLLAGKVLEFACFSLSPLNMPIFIPPQ